MVPEHLLNRAQDGGGPGLEAAQAVGNPPQSCHPCAAQAEGGKDDLGAHWSGGGICGQSAEGGSIATTSTAARNCCSRSAAMLSSSASPLRAELEELQRLEEQDGRERRLRSGYHLSPSGGMSPKRQGGK